MKPRTPIDSSAILFEGAGTWDAIAIAVAGMAPTMGMNLNPQEPAEHVVVSEIVSHCGKSADAMKFDELWEHVVRLGEELPPRRRKCARF